MAYAVQHRYLSNAFEWAIMGILAPRLSITGQKIKNRFHFHPMLTSKIHPLPKVGIRVRMGTSKSIQSRSSPHPLPRFHHTLCSHESNYFLALERSIFGINGQDYARIMPFSVFCMKLWRHVPICSSDHVSAVYFHIHLSIGNTQCNGL